MDEKHIGYKSPCKKDCPKRAFDCHAHCGEYAGFRAKRDEQIQKRLLNRDVQEAIGDAMKRIPGKRGI